MKNTTSRINSSLTIAAGLFLLLIFIACMKYPEETQRSYSYLALGDSYTIGEKVGAKENFPNQVRDILGKKQILLQDPRIIAQTGWTTDELQQAINKENIHPGYNFVSLLIGVNNQYRGRETAGYAAEFESLLQQAISFAGGDASHVIVLSIPDWGVTPFAAGRDREQIAREIDAYNKVNKEIAGRYHAHYLDITSEARNTAGDLSLFADDGLHPSAKEYAKWAELVAAVIQKSI